jgi:hypothetical protein
VFGVAGYVAGLALTMTLARALRMSATAHVVLATVPVLTLFVLLVLAGRGVGRRAIVFYEKAALALAATVFAFAIADEPVARGADLTMIGIGTFLAFGRVGCFHVGCCHGRRARWGVRYGWSHTDPFPVRWVGMPIFPLQLVDAAVSAIAVAVGAAVVFSDAPPGTGLATYLCIYAPGRFVLELFRGDDRRRIVAGLSEAQWTSVIASAAVAMYRPAWWTVGGAALMLVATMILGVARRRGACPSIWLLSAAHLAELDRVLGELIADGPSQVTRERVCLQLRALPDARFELRLGRDGQSLPPRMIRALTRQLGRKWTVIADRPTVVITVGTAREHLIL